MKKVLFLLVTILLSFSNIVSANNSYEVIYSDITVCINHYNIPSFAVNGTSVVSVEDLSKYGMSVENKSGFFRISVVEYRTIDPVKYEIDINQLGSIAGYAKKNVTPVYVNNQQISSYNLNGYTLVPVEELNILGDVCWVPEQKALKLWIDGLHVKPIFEPPVINAESSLYRETVEIVNAYRAVNDFEQAVSALDWTISHLSENSSYYSILKELREEIAYLAATKNIDLSLKGGNLSNAAWNAYYYLANYCTYSSPYYNALATKYAELEYKEAINNVNAHLRKKDYYSAYVTATNAKNSISSYIYENNDSTIYYNKLSDDVKSICKAWRGATGSSLAIVDYWAYKENSTGKISIKFVNLSDKPIKAFKCTADVCDVFGTPLSKYYTNYTLYVDDGWISGYGNQTYTWSFSNSRANTLKYLKVTQVVYNN